MKITSNGGVLSIDDGLRQYESTSDPATLAYLESRLKSRGLLSLPIPASVTANQELTINDPIFSLNEESTMSEFTVTGIPPQQPPNPRCCPDGSKLCGACAARVLAKLGYWPQVTANVDRELAPFGLPAEYISEDNNG